MVQENKKALFIRAFVVSGRGIASEKVATLHKNIKLNNTSLYPGTLNLISKVPVLFIDAAANNAITSHFKFHPVLVNETQCWVRRYPQCPLHIFEVVSDVRLRETLHLTDGDMIQLTISGTIVTPIDFIKRLLWVFVWYGREYWFYRFNWYAKCIGIFLNLRFRLRKLVHLK